MLQILSTQKETFEVKLLSFVILVFPLYRADYVGRNADNWIRIFFIKKIIFLISYKLELCF